MATTNRYGETVRSYMTIVLLNGEPVPCGRFERPVGPNRRDILAYTAKEIPAFLAREKYPQLADALETANSRRVYHLPHPTPSPTRPTPSPTREPVTLRGYATPAVDLDDLVSIPDPDETATDPDAPAPVPDEPAPITQHDPQFAQYCTEGIPPRDYIQRLDFSASMAMHSALNGRMLAATIAMEQAIGRGDVRVQLALYGFPWSFYARQYVTDERVRGERVRGERVRGERVRGEPASLPRHWVPPGHFLEMYSLINRGRLRHDVSYS